ncbi:MAG: TetR/AcrR family transcriptional regulator [Alphaproteobacteria bacterium]|nr:TetR/AcrR family transcriptional regulator [Alphaproteobacteria bacterium]
MAQIKKEAVRQAILDSAYDLFKKQGYTNTSVSQIAGLAGVSTSNIYVYFPSKLKILFAVYDPWLRRSLDRLEADLEAIDNPADRLRKIFRAVWCDIPAEDGGFPNCLMQALSTGSVEQGYERDLLFESENMIAKLIAKNLPAALFKSEEIAYLSHVIFMAHDGFTINLALRGPSRRIDGVIETMVSLLLGKRPGADIRAADVTASG